MIAYGAVLDVSRELVAYVASLLAARRRARGTRRRSRVLSCGKQALFALVWFRRREDLTVLATGFGISRATGYGGAGIGIRVPFERPADGCQLGVDDRTYDKLLHAMRASANVASPCWWAAGASCSTSPPVPAASAIS